MEHLYQRLTQLLGRSPNGEYFEQFIADLGEQPLTNGTTYTFHKVGVTLASFDNFFEAAMFHLNTPSTRVANVSPYRGDFLNDITAADNADSVRKKLGLCPVASENRGSDLKHIQETYEIPPLILVFTFNAGSKQMSSLSVGKSSAISRSKIGKDGES